MSNFQHTRMVARSPWRPRGAEGHLGLWLFLTARGIVSGHFPFVRIRAAGSGALSCCLQKFLKIEFTRICDTVDVAPLWDSLWTGPVYVCSERPTLRCWVAEANFELLCRVASSAGRVIVSVRDMD